MSIADKLALLANTKEGLRLALGLSKSVPFSEYINSPLLPFTPFKLFKSGKQGLWYDPSDLSTMFQDAAGTIPVTANGDPVGLIKDKSGNGNHATQTLVAARPTYQTDGILHWLQFDGVDDILSLPISFNDVVYVGDSPNLITSFATSEALDSGVSPVFANSDGSGSLRQFYLDVYRNSLRIIFGNDSVTTSLPLGNRTITLEIVPDRTCYTYVNNSIANQSTVPLLQKATYPVRLFGRAQSSGDTISTYEGNFYGSVIVKGSTDVTARVRIDKYLTSKAGVTL